MNIYKLAVQSRNVEKNKLGKVLVGISSRFFSLYPVNDDLYGLSEDQKQLRRTTSDFLRKTIAPKVAKIDKDNEFPQFREFLKECGKLGLNGMTVPVKYGGTEALYLDHCIVMEEMARVSSAVAVSYGAHSNLCVNQIVRNGSVEQKARYLPKLCSGELLGALAIGEVNVGSDIMSMQCHAEKKGENYVLNGNKFLITNGSDADVFVIYAKSDVSVKSQPKITAFIVEKGTPGFKQGAKIDIMGQRGSNAAKLTFDNCLVPQQNVLGTENEGAEVLLTGLDIERGLFGAGALGIMQACCDLAFDYAHDREAFGQKIGAFQLMQSKLANMYTILSVSRSHLYNVARAFDNGKIISKDCAACILFIAENATKMALETIQILGGNGYTNDYPASRLLRDAKLFEIGAGTSDMRRLLIGRAINAEYGIGSIAN